VRLTEENLELRFGNHRVGFSARRIWEHTEYGQVNPSRMLPPSLVSDPGHFISIVSSKFGIILSGRTDKLTFLTENILLVVAFLSHCTFPRRKGTHSQ
jgi:hypothetical protein